MTLLDIQQYAITDHTWTPIRILGTVLKLWLEFPADLKLRSVAGDATTETTLSVAVGSQFIFPLPESVTFSGIVCYAQAVAGNMTIKRMAIKAAQ